MKYCLTCLFAILLAGTSTAQNSAPKGVAKCAVQGTVIQEPGEHPLKKTKIQLMGQGLDGSTNYSATTDAEGYFKIEDVNPGRYRILLERAGFVEGDKGGGRKKSLVLEPGREIKGLVLRMNAAAVLTGKILDSDGEPMPNVAVSVSRYGSSSSRRNFQANGYGSTNDLGEYRIGGLSPGRYLITAAPPSSLGQATQSEKNDASKEETVYTTTYYPGTADKSQAVPLEMHAGEEVPINFGLVTTRAFRVRGTVTKLSPGSFASVILRSRGDTDSEVGMKTVGTDGSFEFRDVPPGPYTLTLVMVSIPDMRMERSNQNPIDVSNEDVNGVHIEPVPGGEIRGQFRMDKSQKIDWSQLSVFLSSDEEAGSAVAEGDRPTFAQVKNDGSFEMKNVPSGTYRVIVGSSSQTLRDYFTKSVNLGGKDVSDSGFTVSGATYSLDVMLSPRGGTIEGTVLDSEDQAVAYATVVCVPNAEHRKRPDLYQQDTSDQRGHFSLHGLNPDDYTVLAWEDLEGNYRDPEFLKSYEARGQGVRLDEGERKTISVKVISSSVEQP
jgi:Carboxypeptidase regulatory-like domain